MSVIRAIAFAVLGLIAAPVIMVAAFLGLVATGLHDGGVAVWSLLRPRATGHAAALDERCRNPACSPCALWWKLNAERAP